MSWTSDEDYAAAVARMIRAFGRRMAGADAEHLPMLAELADAVDDAVAVAVAAMKERGVSWAEIGEAFGVTRQAAHQKWGRGGAA